MRILFVISEASPLAKTGGLADVAGALPKALARLGHDVRLIMPRYRLLGGGSLELRRVVDNTPIQVGVFARNTSLLETKLPGSDVPVYLVDAPEWFDRDGLYQDRGVDYPDNLERFSGFVQAVLKLMPQAGWQPELVHAHDWQTALLCAHLRLTHADHPFWSAVGLLFTIHNLAYQGTFPQPQWPLTNLPPSAFSMQGLEFWGKINGLKGGLLFADLLSTVSPAYAKEIQTPEFGCGLEGVIGPRAAHLSGILNGIDVDEWNPKTDPHIASHYSVDELAGKAVCKLALQRQQKLPQRAVPVIGMVQRLVEQKGIDLLVEALPELMAMDLQLIILGTGEPAYHAALSEQAKRYPDRLAVNLKFDNALAHQIEAGCDAFLMPSRFEPCGLNQMYSMRYGTVPIVRKVGGLADTVVDLSPQAVEQGAATGFTFADYSSRALIETVARALAAFRDPGAWFSLVRAGMQRDFSWERSAREYVQLYDRTLSRRHANDPDHHAQSVA